MKPQGMNHALCVQSIFFVLKKMARALSLALGCMLASRTDPQRKLPTIYVLPPEAAGILPPFIFLNCSIHELLLDKMKPLLRLTIFSPLLAAFHQHSASMEPVLPWCFWEQVRISRDLTLEC